MLKKLLVVFTFYVSLSSTAFPIPNDFYSSEIFNEIKESLYSQKIDMALDLALSISDQEQLSQALYLVSVHYLSSHQWEAAMSINEMIPISSIQDMSFCGVAIWLVNQGDRKSAYEIILRVNNPDVRQAYLMKYNFSEVPCEG